MSDSNSSDSEDETITHTEPTDDGFNIQALVAAAADAESAEHATNNLKRRVSSSSSSSEEEQKKKPEQKSQNISNVVATHYNQLEEKGYAGRKESRIFFMRKFHNWIKSMLIEKHINKIKEVKKRGPIVVLDMCCGKGGDLFKWQSAGISQLVCTDIAEVSLDQCESRYEQMRQRGRQRDNLFSIEYIHADCSRIRLKDKYDDPDIKFDMVSCQFSFHYSFESLPQAECMMRNAAECLAPGGYFLLTIPNANELVARMRKSGADSFGNDVYTVKFDCDVNNPPLFGGMYHFQLDGVVDCPEFLVHVPTLQKLAERFNLIPILKQGFPKFYKDMKKVGTNLLCNMRTLELYPPHDGARLVGSASDDYTHAERYLEMLPDRDPNKRLGTLSKSEWEASSLYLVLAFLKARD